MSATTSSPSATLAPPVALAPTVGFRRLIQTEARKMIDTRSGRWLLIITIALALAGAGLGISLYSTLAGRIGPNWHDTLMAFVLAAPSVLVPVMAILTVSNEWTQRTALTTFTLEPRRGRVTAAKGVVMWLAATLCWLLVIAVTAASTAIGAGIADMTVDWTTHWSSLLGNYVVFVLVMFSAFALALAFQHPAASIVVFFAVPVVAAALMGFGGTIATVVGWTDLQQATATLTTTWSLTGGQWARVSTSAALWIVLPLVVGVWRQSATEPR